MTALANGLPAPSTTLERLPVELRRKIFSHLLISDQVRQPPDKLLVRSYRFETAILSANKKIHCEASDLLYNENRFVTVSCDWHIIFTVMKNHEVAIVCDKPALVARFKRAVMRLHIKFHWAQHALGTEVANKKSGKVLESFLILADDLPSFTRMIHIMNMTNGGDRQNTKYNFRMEPTSAGVPSLGLQKTLLEPFRYLYTREGCVKFSAVESEYAQDLGRTMMPPVHWVRDAAWRLYNVCVSIKEVGDQALRMGNYDLAFAKYEDAQTVHVTGVHNNNKVGAVEDEGFHTACDRLWMICEMNIFLASLKAGADPTEVMEAPEAADFVLRGANPIKIQERWGQMSQLQKSRLYHYRGIGYSIKDNDKLAFDSLRRAYQLDSSDEGIKRDLLIVNRRLTAKTPKAKAAAGTIEASRLCNEPLELDPPIFTRSKFVNTERYVLRKFGYQGDMLEHIEGSEPVDMEAVAAAEQSAAKQRALLQSKKLENPISWIGGGMPSPQEIHGLGFLRF